MKRELLRGRDHGAARARARGRRPGRDRPLQHGRGSGSAPGGAIRLLILGGTKFLGRATVEAALERGHEVTTFTRGQTNPGLWAEIEELRGDRDGDLGALEGREWDAVFDTSGYFPRVVRASAELLEGQVEHYTFTSSVSVYADLSVPPSESSPLATLEDETVEEFGEEFENYGALKALPEQPFQFIDVRDLALWIVQMIENRTSGAFNATNESIPLEELIAACPGEPEVVWAAPEFLVKQGVDESELPLWTADPQYAAIHQAEVSAAVGAGLTFRPPEETARDTLEWDRSRGQNGKVGLDPDREAGLLTAWRSR